MVVNIVIFYNDTNILQTPKDDSLFGFCNIVNSTLAYFMNGGDNSLRMLGGVCNSHEYKPVVPGGIQLIEPPEKHVVICIYSTKEYRHQQSCEIIKSNGAHYDDFLMIKIGKDDKVCFNLFFFSYVFAQTSVQTRAGALYARRC